MTPDQIPTPRPTGKHIDACIDDCERGASSEDDLAVICGKMTLRTVVSEAKRARILERELNEAERKLRLVGYYGSNGDVVRDRDQWKAMAISNLTLATAIARYAQHRDLCPMPMNNCTCGLDNLLVQLGSSLKQPEAK